jgi:hypothetical protein
LPLGRLFRMSRLLRFQNRYSMCTALLFKAARLASHLFLITQCSTPMRQLGSKRSFTQGCYTAPVHYSMSNSTAPARWTQPS